MQNVSMEQAAALLAEQLPKGVFCCVGGETPNVMTVGWGGLTYFWRKHVFVAPVRRQRHTYPLLKEQGIYTISVPAPGTMQQALMQAGTLSGSDGDKFAAIGLQTRAAQAVDAPVVAGCALYLECRVLAETDFTALGMAEEVVSSAYPAGDFHTLFLGDIVACYRGE